MFHVKHLVRAQRFLELEPSNRYTYHMKKNKHKLLKLLFFSAACAGALHLVNRLINYVAVGKGEYNKDEYLTYGWANGPVKYIRKGEGSPVLLIHHIDPFASSYEWHAVISDLAKTHTVYAVDLPGCGLSAKSCITYVSFYFVQFIEAFLRDVIGEKAAIIASGSSGSVALAAASYNDALMDRLILLNPTTDTGSVNDSRKQALLVNLLKLPIIGTFIYALRFNRARIDADLAETHFYNPFNITSDLVDTGFANVHLGNDNGRYLYASQVGGYMAVDPSLALGRVSLPIYSLVGKKAAAKEDAAKLFEHTNLTDCYEFAKSGSFPQIEEPELFIEQVEKYLSSDEPLFETEE